MTKRERQRPFVVATFAMTVDGKVTTRTLAPVDFTSREDKLHLFRQRALADAVLIGHTSLERDNVRLGLPAELQEARNRRRQSRCRKERRSQRRQEPELHSAPHRQCVGLNGAAL